MAQGVALLVGVKDVSMGGLGCERDVDNMAKVLSGAGEYTINILKTELATASTILACIKAAASTLVSGDMFVFYFSGHGSQKPDTNGDEADGMDETLCTYASEITDDQLAKRWKRFAAGVRIVMLSDCCHSGTNSDLKRKPINFAGKTRGMKAQLIHFGACRDDQESSAGPAGGAFTLELVDVWNEKEGNFSGYKHLHDEIRTRLNGPPKYFPQEPQFNTYGNVQPDFLNSRPFSIS